jgi:hypothetical protein
MLAELTRRKFIGFLSALHLVAVGKSAAAENSEITARLPIHDVHLPPDQLRDLESYAAPVIEAARSLDELDLGNLPVSRVEPTLLFEPGRFYPNASSRPADSEKQ